MEQEVESIDIKCQKCGSWFPSPIFIGGDISFITSTLSNNKAQCSHCGEMTGCDKEHMRVKFKGGSGGFIGDQTNP